MEVSVIFFHWVSGLMEGLICIHATTINIDMNGDRTGKQLHLRSLIYHGTNNLRL